MPTSALLSFAPFWAIREIWNVREGPSQGADVGIRAPIVSHQSFSFARHQALPKRHSSGLRTRRAFTGLLSM